MENRQKMNKGAIDRNSRGPCQKSLKSYQFVKYGSFVFKNNFYIVCKFDSGYYIFYKILEIISYDEENYFLKICMEKFSFSKIMGYYEHIGSVNAHCDILNLFEAWHSPIEPYIQDNILALIPHFYYFENTN